MTSNKLTDLQKKIGYKFSDSQLISAALTHSSAGKKNLSYERLEFLGDRVLGLLLADYLYHHFESDDEGLLSLRLHSGARMESLVKIGRSIGLQNYIIAQVGLDLSKNESVIADVVESITAAIYLDGGISSAREFLRRFWSLESDLHAVPDKDAKSRLQDWCLKRGLELPSYRQVAKSGPDHAPTFLYEVTINGHSSEFAEGASRKIAEQKAASSLLIRIGSTSSKTKTVKQ